MRFSLLVSSFFDVRGTWVWVMRITGLRVQFFGDIFVTNFYITCSRKGRF